MITSSCKNRFGRVPIGTNRTATKTYHILSKFNRPVVSTKCTRNICFEPLPPFWQIVWRCAYVELVWAMVPHSHLAVCSASVAVAVAATATVFTTMQLHHYFNVDGMPAATENSSPSNKTCNPKSDVAWGKILIKRYKHSPSWTWKCAIISKRSAFPMDHFIVLQASKWLTQAVESKQLMLSAIQWHKQTDLYITPAMPAQRKSIPRST